MTCGRKIGPYDCCSVVEGDCLELMKALPDGCVDAVITDPPYGIGAGRMNFGKWRTSMMPKSDWDSTAGDVSTILELCVPTVIWGGNYFNLPPSRCFLVWNKGAGFKGRDFAECEIAWTNIDANAREFTYDPLAHGDYREKLHPTQKPESLMLWCIRQIKAETILDPFCGSGTTLVAAAKLGRHFLGFEISPEYCAIARKRIALVEAQPNLFQPKAEQLTLGEGTHATSE
jgi:DNA modification methylase